MPIGIKILFTSFIVILGIVIIFINPKNIVPFRSDFWRRGENDPIRKLLFKTDGKPRKYLKHSILLWFLLAAILIWSLP